MDGDDVFPGKLLGFFHRVSSACTALCKDIREEALKAGKLRKARRLFVEVHLFVMSAFYDETVCRRQKVFLASNVSRIVEFW